EVRGDKGPGDEDLRRRPLAHAWPPPLLPALPGLLARVDRRHDVRERGCARSDDARYRQRASPSAGSPAAPQPGSARQPEPGAREETITRLRYEERSMKRARSTERAHPSPDEPEAAPRAAPGHRHGPAARAGARPTTAAPRP